MTLSAGVFFWEVLGALVLEVALAVLRVLSSIIISLQYRLSIKLFQID
jgi:hypothetical protein